MSVQLSNSSTETKSCEENQQCKEMNQRMWKSKMAAKSLEIFILTVAFIVTVGLLSIPTILRFTQEVILSTGQTLNTTETETVPVNHNNSECEKLGSFTPFTTTCNALSWAVDEHNCSPVAYTGSVCREALLQWQNCIVGQTSSTTIFISISELQSQLEQQVSETIQVLNQFAADDCQKEAIPFVCLYGFPICSCSNYKIYLPSQDYCESILMTSCRNEFQVATNLGYSDIVPECNKLPMAYHSMEESGSTLLVDEITQQTALLNLTCSDTFYQENSTCLPLCDAWEESSSSTTINVIVAVATAMGTISGAVVIIASILQYKKMFKFPSIFIVFMTSNATLIALCEFISIVDRGLFCSSKDLLISLHKPTVFCKIIGVVTHYVLVSTSLWWLFHVASMFYTVNFPFHAQKTLFRYKCIYLIPTFIAAVSPLPAIIVIFTSKKYQFVPNNSPPTLCVSSNVNMLFYSLMLFNNIILLIGVPMLLYLLWTVHKKWIIRHKYKKGKSKISVIETKIFIALIYYAVFGVVILLHFGLTIANQGVYSYEVQKYFICEAKGSGSECDRSQYEQYQENFLRCITYVLFGFFPSVNLIFVISWKSVKQVFLENFYRKILSRSTRSLQHIEMEMKI